MLAFRQKARWHRLLWSTLPRNIREAIIFGLGDNDELLPEAARAFLRHAYNCFYHDFANVELKDAAFHWQLTFNASVISFRNAVLRYARRITLLFNTRLHTNLQGVVPLEARERYPALINISIEGEFALKNPFKTAIADAQKAADDHLATHVQRQQNARRR